MVGAPIVVGLYARRLPHVRRFGTLLAAAGAGWFLASLSASQDDLVHSIGRVSGWIVEVFLVYLVLAFPSGSLGRVDRALVGGMALVIALLYLPTAVLVEQYPTPSPWTSCGADCPGNAFMLTSAEPAVVDDVLRPLRELLTVAIFVAATVRLGRRIGPASHVMRRTLAPVLSVAIFRLAAMAIGTVSRAVAPNSSFTEVVAWLIALALPALACAFLIGLIRWRLFMAAAMERLAVRLRRHPGPGDLRDASRRRSRTRRSTSRAHLSGVAGGSRTGRSPARGRAACGAADGSPRPARVARRRRIHQHARSAGRGRWPALHTIEPRRWYQGDRHHSARSRSVRHAGHRKGARLSRFARQGCTHHQAHACLPCWQSATAP